ncbi:MAG TPA: geranylgeranyl reductase family protein [Acidimicrobiales bacterium]|nr:geranylgeranyl reductase family protein [Acidimicrobiales bacterium]
MLDADVAVVGGGPAGAAAAITLARAGRDVVVLDKARFPRDKCCGDGLTAAALRHLERLGLRPDGVPSWQPVDDVWVRGPSGHSVRFPLPGPGVFAAIATRTELDAALLDVARAEGAKVLDGHALTGATPIAEGSAVQLDVDGMEPIVAPYAIGADGAWSPLRHALGANQPGYLGDWHAFRQYFSGVGPLASSMWVWFDADLLPGYAWSFPLPGGRANVGFGILRSAGIPVREMKAMWPDLLARSHIRDVLGPGAHPEAPHKAWPIPARIDSVPLTAAGGRALFVGDAACATDALTGEGIAQALLTGERAAEAIIAAGPARATGAASRYENAVRRELFADHRMSVLLGRALSHRKGARVAIRVAGATRWTRHNFARWLFEDYPRALAVTPERWHRGALSTPGAYASG